MGQSGFVYNSNLNLSPHSSLAASVEEFKQSVFLPAMIPLHKQSAAKYNLTYIIKFRRVVSLRRIERFEVTWRGWKLYTCLLYCTPYLENEHRPYMWWYIWWANIHSHLRQIQWSRRHMGGPSRCDEDRL